MNRKRSSLLQENPFISLRNPSDLTQNFHLLSSSYLFKDDPNRPNYDEELSLIFEEIFKSHIPQEELNAIPKIIHVIWIGPKEYPAASTLRLAKWLSFHPDWKLYFWTDHTDRSLPHPKAIRKQAYVLKQLEKYYDESVNYGEMSDLIRISILYDLGGLYIDHDLDCLRSIDPLTEMCDFLATCEYPGECGEFTYLDHLTLQTKQSSFSITNSLIGSRPLHPVWNQIIKSIEEDWDYYTHHPRMTDIQKTMHRTYLPFTRGILEFDPRSYPSFALLPSLFHAPVSAIRLGEEIFQKIEGWIFATNYYESLWK